MAQPTKGSLAIVDDEVELMRALCETLGEQGFATTGFTSPAEALEAVRGGSDFDILFSDLMMPGMDGVELLKQCRATDPNLVCIIMTGQGSIQTAVEAMKAGAFDYILKPFKLQHVLPVLERGLEVRRLRRENTRLRRIVGELTFESSRYRIVGESPEIRRVLQMLEKVAGTDATVLVRGESGTGKELIARAVHGNSARKDSPLVTVNCATLQESLLESELFGHEKGSFTGADRAKPGLFEVAEGGTLFIDEVAEMSPALQAKLLRVLEDGHYRRVGATQERRANVRVVAATNKPLEEEQKSGRFRSDLYYRLNVLTIELPPLRERRMDIPLLVEHFLRTRRFGNKEFHIEPDALNALVRYDWPGNIRELANVVERAQILAEGGVITCDDLPETVTSGAPITHEATPVHPDHLDGMEKRHVAEVLARHDGNKVQAAKALGVSRRSLYRLIEKHRLA
ncbi:MAG: sigma-54 dependent transcriptional regulator [Gemmataceae bacterium]